MNAKALACAALVAAAAAAAPPLPELRVEPTEGGSIFYIRNTGSQPLAGYLIELVNYPGSFYMLWQDEPGAPIAPGAEKPMQVSNMIVGAVPDYVKLQAAVYEDGTTAGVPERVAQFIERRRAVLKTTRELIQRLDKPGAARDALAAELKQWGNSIPTPTRANRGSQEGIDAAATRELIADTVAQLESQPPAHVLSALRLRERALAVAVGRAAARPT